MKLLIASDLHGSLYYVEKLMEIIELEQVDLVIFLGDYLYHGPRNPLTKDYNPKEVAKLLNQIKDKVVGIRGNCDSEVDQMVLEFPMLADYAQLLVDNYNFFLIHGHKYDEALIPKLNNTVMLSGHTHIPLIQQKGNQIFLNPGSISLPKENNPNTYAIYENQVFQIKTLDGKVCQQL